MHVFLQKWCVNWLIDIFLILILFFFSIGKAASRAHVWSAALWHHGCRAGQRCCSRKIPTQIYQVRVSLLTAQGYMCVIFEIRFLEAQLTQSSVLCWCETWTGVSIWISELQPRRLQRRNTTRALRRRTGLGRRTPLTTEPHITHFT